MLCHEDQIKTNLNLTLESMTKMYEIVRAIFLTNIYIKLINHLTIYRLHIIVYHNIYKYRKYLYVMRKKTIFVHQ